MPAFARSRLDRRWIAAVAGSVVLVTVAIVLPLCGRAKTSSVEARYVGGTNLSGAAILQASATAPGASIVAVDFYLDGKLIGTSTTPPYVLDPEPGLIGAGEHGLKVVAIDNRGRTGASRTVEISYHGSPTVATVSPRQLGRVLRALAAGNVTVRLSPGRYPIGGARVGPGARLVGSGTKTILQAPAGRYSAVLFVRGSHVRISDLRIDGAGPGRGAGDAISIAPGVSDVRVSRVRITRVRGVGVHALGGNGSVSVQGSRIYGGGTASAGVLVADGSRNASVLHTRIQGFRDWGIDFVHVATGDTEAIPHVLALGNTISEINDPDRANGTNESAIWSGGTKAAIIGNVISRTGWDGIETVGSSLEVSVVRNRISGTRTGIYVEHSTNHSLFESNRITNVGTGIDVEWTYGGVGSDDNSFVSNRVWDAHQGLFVDVGDDGNLIDSNTFVDVTVPVTLQGSSGNTVRRNRACRAAGRLVSQMAGLRDDRTSAYAKDNRLSNNELLSCSKL
jgi:hypothetical protein